ncbi:unnamed protein product [Paramecium sonneborni]|uniref:NACHT domain-containing protein n=1 Tax=Paramecium sonneborni TaxID=65129 RepID=A0A8S1M701_9CILI|nr:unnamed protein product [Paramecium sonneborni]
MNSIYIKLKTNRRTYSSNNNKYHQDKYDAKIHFLLQEEDDENGNEVKQADVNLFLDFDKKSDVMLIRGQAGSGKSRAAKKIEEFIWKRHQRNQQDWIPIFISLPSLKDPIKNLFNEAMESDYYHFDRIQIRELKDAISNNRERVVLILDSYDELKNDIKSKNLYQTNDLAQQFNIKPEDNKNLKIIITTRSELLQDKNFASWFVGSDIKAFIDIELQQFSEKEIKEYLDKYSHLSVKNKIYGLYEYVQQIEGKKVDPEDVKLIQSKISPFIKKQSIDNIEVDKKQILLNGHKVKNILDNIKLLPYFKNLRDEQIIKLEKELLELWSQEKYQDSIDNLNISNILQTPYMMEIVVQVLPNFAKIYSEVAQIKELFKKNYLAIKESEKNSKLIIEKYKSKIRNQQQRYINNYNDEPDQQYNKLLKIMEEIKFFQNFSILNNLNQINTYPGLEADDKNAIISSYRQKIFTTYEFYENFINFYHAQQMIKQQRLGNVSNFEALRIDLWVYAESLALEMTLNDQTYFTHQISGLLKLEKLQEIKKPEKNWLDQYFDGTEKEQEYKNLIRSCILLTCKGNVYSFTHKSIQEFFAAKYVINLFQDFFENKKYTNEEIQKSIYNNDKFNISKANFQKISEFIINYFKGREQVFVNQLIEILKLSQKEDFLVRSASNSLFLLSQFKAFLGGQSLQNLKISDTKINGLSFFNSNLSRSIFENVEIDGCNFNLAKIEDVIWKIICKEQRTLSEHKQKVTALTMSLDGKRLYSGSIQGEIICWDYAQRKKQHIKQHNDQINCLIISPDGQLLASTGKKNTITLWNSITLEIIKLLEEHTDEVNSINFLQDKNEKLLASGSSDQTILLWNYDKMQRIKQPLKHKTKVMQLVIFPNSKQLASRCLDNCIRIWNINIEFPQIIQIFLNQSFELRSIGISADGQNLIAGYKYQQEQQDEVCVGVWVLRQESCRRELEIQKSKKIFSLAIFLQSEQLSTNKKTIIIAGSQNVIIFWQENLNENELIQKGSVEALAFSKDQKLLISASEIEIKLWNCYNDFTLNKLIDLNLDSILNSPIKKLALIDNNLIFWTQNKNIYYIQQNENQDVLTINCDGDVQEIEFGQSYIICGGNDEAIQIYKYYQSNFTNYDILENYSDERNPSKGINFLALSLDEQFLASADKNQMIYLFTITDRLWSLFHQFDTQKIVTSLSFIPTKNLLAFGCDDKTLILWDKDEKTIIDQFAGHSGQISMINSSSDGSLLIYKIYNEESQEQIGKQFKGIKSDVIQIVTSPNDEKFLGIGEDQQIQIWDLQSEKIKPSPITKKVDLTCALINQENNLITGQNNGDIIIWQMINEDENKFADGQLAQFGHSENINSLCFSPDGLNLVSSSEDKILVWDIQKNKKIEQINQSALQVMYFPNYPEKQLLLIRQQKKILIWNIIQREELRFQITDKVITAIDIIEESQQVVYGLDDGNILIWNNNGQDQPQKLEKKHDQKVNSISSKFDGSFLVLGSNDCKISIWKKDQHQLYEFVEFKEVHKNKVKVVIFTPDGQYLASGDSEGIIYIWVTDAYYEQEIHTEQYNCEIITMAFSQDGKILATGYNDKCIKIWKTEELILIQTIQRENENVFSISFSIDDKLAYSFGSDINLCANYLDINQNAQYIAYQTYTKYPILQAEKCQIKNCKIDDATDQNQSLLELFLQKKAIKEE